MRNLVDLLQSSERILGHQCSISHLFRAVRIGFVCLTTSIYVNGTGNDHSLGTCYSRRDMVGDQFQKSLQHRRLLATPCIEALDSLMA